MMFHRKLNALVMRTMGYTPLRRDPRSSRPSQEETLPLTISWSSPASLRCSSECSDHADIIDLEKQAVRKYSKVKRYLAYLHPVPFILTVFIPSFLRRDGNATGARKPTSTAWLDGLRGVAALLVVFHHTSLLLFPWHIHDGYGISDSPSHHLFIQLPIIRLVISGPPQVCTFFVVSGYALSYRSLTLVSLGQQVEFSSNLASSILRRHPRLFIPACAASLLSALLTAYGAFGDGKDVIPGAAQPFRSPPNAGGLVPQLWNWYYNELRLANPFAWNMNAPTGDPYDPNQWTLPIEFAASLIVFLLLAGTSKFRPLSRLMLFIIVVGWAAWKSYFAPVLFVGGMAIAEMRVQAERRHERSGVDPVWLHLPPRKMVAQWYPWSARAVALVGFVVALYFLSMPEWDRGGPQAWGYSTVIRFTPGGWQGLMRNFFWPVVGAIMIVSVLDHSVWLQGLFNTHLAQYLGKISFALYLVHGPILYSVSRPIAVTLSARLETTDTSGQVTTAAKFGGTPYGLTILGTALVSAPVILIVSDAGARLVDEATVRMLKKFYGCFVQN